MASMSGMKIATSDPFDALNMIDTNECDIPTDVVAKDRAELDSGSTMESYSYG